MKTCELFSMLPYNWRSYWYIPSYTGRIRDIFQYFNWKEFNWKPPNSLKRFLYFFFIISISLLGELNTFYLKYILWIPPPNFLCLGRLFFMWLIAAVAMRESFEYLDNP